MGQPPCRTEPCSDLSGKEPLLPMDLTPREVEQRMLEEGGRLGHVLAGAHPLSSVASSNDAEV